MLMRLRIAEIREDAVSHVLGDIAPEPRDDLSYGAMISAEQLPQIFGIKARCQRCRADQIAKQNSELAALGRAGADAGICALSHRLD